MTHRPEKGQSLYVFIWRVSASMLETQTRRTCSGRHPAIKAALTHRPEIRNVEMLVFSKQGNKYIHHICSIAYHTQLKCCRLISQPVSRPELIAAVSLLTMSPGDSIQAWLQSPGRAYSTSG